MPPAQAEAQPQLAHRMPSAPHRMPAGADPGLGGRWHPLDDERAIVSVGVPLTQILCPEIDDGSAVCPFVELQGQLVLVQHHRPRWVGFVDRWELPFVEHALTFPLENLSTPLFETLVPNSRTCRSWAPGSRHT